MCRMDYDSAANYAIMNQLCKVCGEPAAGFHFGAFTCEGCKSFFGRTYNNLSSISECKNNGKCVINKKNRTACKACRLRKCMMVGMSKSGSRYGRRSNWFKIHCLLQQQQAHGAQQNNNNNSINNNTIVPHHQPFTQMNHIHQQMTQLNHQQQVEMNLAAAASLFRPNPYLSPLFRGHHGASGSLVGVPRDTSESDSGASSADPDEDIRSASALSYLRPPTSPLSDKISSDTESLSRRKNNHPLHKNQYHSMGQSDPEVYNRHSSSKTADVSTVKVSESDRKIVGSDYIKHQPHKSALERSTSDIESYTKRKSLSITPLPPISPTSLPPISPSALVVPNRPWFPPPFPMTDPIAWRDFWLRNQPSLAAPAPDQSEPIDLSLKDTKDKESERNSESESEKGDDLGGDIDVEGEGEAVTRVAPLDLTLER